MIKILYHLLVKLLKTRRKKKKVKIATHDIVIDSFLFSSEAGMFHKHTEITIRIAGNICGT